MQADAFWKNYMAAQEWQKRHSVTWWKSRCLALEYENEILRSRIRELFHNNKPQNTFTHSTNKWQEENQDDTEGEEEEEEEEEEDEELDSDDEENLEFQVNEDMMSFLEQSIRHKIELQQKRESELTDSQEEVEAEGTSAEASASLAETRIANAKFLYGEDSSKILAMEAALQVTVDRYKEKAKPQYWPNIPLNL